MPFFDRGKNTCERVGWNSINLTITVSQMQSRQLCLYSDWIWYKRHIKDSVSLYI